MASGYLLGKKNPLAWTKSLFTDHWHHEDIFIRCRKEREIFSVGY